MPDETTGSTAFDKIANHVSIVLLARMMMIILPAILTPMIISSWNDLRAVGQEVVRLRSDVDHMTKDQDKQQLVDATQNAEWQAAILKIETEIAEIRGRLDRVVLAQTEKK